MGGSERGCSFIDEKKDFLLNLLNTLRDKRQDLLTACRELFDREWDVLTKDVIYRNVFFAVPPNNQDQEKTTDISVEFQNHVDLIRSKLGPKDRMLILNFDKADQIEGPYYWNNDDKQKQEQRRQRARRICFYVINQLNNAMSLIGQEGSTDPVVVEIDLDRINLDNMDNQSQTQKLRWIDIFRHEFLKKNDQSRIVVVINGYGKKAIENCGFMMEQKYVQDGDFTVLLRYVHGQQYADSTSGSPWTHVNYSYVGANPQSYSNDKYGTTVIYEDTRSQVPQKPGYNEENFNKMHIALCLGLKELIDDLNVCLSGEQRLGKTTFLQALGTLHINNLYVVEVINDGISDLVQKKYIRQDELSGWIDEVKSNNPHALVIVNEAAKQYGADFIKKLKSSGIMVLPIITSQDSALEGYEVIEI